MQIYRNVERGRANTENRDNVNVNNEVDTDTPLKYEY